METISFDYNAFQEWIPAAERVFAVARPRSVLEHGLGNGTKFFLDRCHRVVSIEWMVKPEHTKWVQTCQQMFQDHQLRWTIIPYACSGLLATEDEMARIGRYPEILRCRSEIDEVLASVYQDISPDVIFVDAGIHLRGTLVQASFDHAPIILAHDTNIPVYGWARIDVPNHYVCLKLAEGLGTTAWIEKSQTELIHALS